MLHDWTDRPGWEGLYLDWMTEIARGLRAVLPVGYQAVIGNYLPMTAEDTDVAIDSDEPDKTLMIVSEGRVVGIIELISPRYKDHPQARELYTLRYVNYLRSGLNLVIVDVHRQPDGFSFSKSIAVNLKQTIATETTPFTMSYHIGGPTPQGSRSLGVWHHPLIVGQPIPSIPLALSPDVAVMIDLDSTYTRAAADSYIT